MLRSNSVGTNGREGISPIRQHAELLGLGLAAQQYGKDFFDGGGRPTGLITLRGTPLQKDGWERLTALWNKAATKLRESKNKTLLLPADLDYKALTIAPEDAQFIETRKMNRSEIASIFNVPAHMINYLEKATFSNISEQGIQFVRHTMMPWVVNWEQELNRKIFTAAERRAGYYVKANLPARQRPMRTLVSGERSTPSSSKSQRISKAMQKKSLCLLIVALMLAGCAVSPKPLPPPSKPQLDSSLVAPCEIPDAPQLADYDAWQAWAQGAVLQALVTCAIRHKKTVAAWPS